MRLIKRVIDRVSCGFVTLLVQEPEDLWHAYHIIQEGDKVTTQTIRWKFLDRYSYSLTCRKVQSTSSTGSSVCDRVKITLTVIVKVYTTKQEATSSLANKFLIGYIRKLISRLSQMFYE